MNALKKSGVLCCLLFFVFLSAAKNSYANKSSITITAPETAAKGSEVLIKLSITHSGNSFFHYTNWVTLKANGKEISHWDFTSSKRPEAADFIREIKIPIMEPMELTAEANCNIHGSAGPAKWKISIKE
jgi:desulfoferrodoxin (superoxide reductase-like protein)